jgi:hypothetical protein
MPDKGCQDACNAAYSGAVAQCTNVLTSCLALAKNDAESEACKDRFRKCMALAKEVREICLGTCG